MDKEQLLREISNRNTTFSTVNQSYTNINREPQLNTQLVTLINPHLPGIVYALNFFDLHDLKAIDSRLLTHNNICQSIELCLSEIVGNL